MKRGKDLPKASMVAVDPCLGSYKGFHQESVATGAWESALPVPGRDSLPEMSLSALLGTVI